MYSQFNVSVYNKVPILSEAAAASTFTIQYYIWKNSSPRHVGVREQLWYCLRHILTVRNKYNEHIMASGTLITEEYNLAPEVIFAAGQ